MSKTFNLQLPPLWPHQAKFAADNAPIVVVVSGTKAGKTASAATVAVLDAVNMPGSMIWWVAPVYRQAEIGFRILKKLVRDIPSVKITNSRLMIELPNKSIIECRSAEIADNLYGEGVNSMIIEEAGRISNASLYALESTVLATGGQQRYISNPGPTEGHFFKLCQLGKDPTQTDYSYHHWQSSDSPLVSKEVLDRRRAALPEQMYRSLYEGEFLEGEDAVFHNVAPSMRVPLAEVLGPHSQCLNNGMANSSRQIGVDLGRHHDATVIIGIVDRPGGDGYRIGYFDRFTKQPWDEVCSRIERACRVMLCGATIETNGPGDVVYENLRKRQGLSLTPFITTNKIKQIAILGLARELTEGRVDLAPCEPLAGELAVYRYRQTPMGAWQYSAPDGMSDDCVMSLAIAAYARRVKGGLRAHHGVDSPAASADTSMRSHSDNEGSMGLGSVLGMSL
jgi:hypothetical protein